MICAAFFIQKAQRPVTLLQNPPSSHRSEYIFSSVAWNICINCILFSSFLGGAVATYFNSKKGTQKRTALIFNISNNSEGGIKVGPLPFRCDAGWHRHPSPQLVSVFVVIVSPPLLVPSVPCLESKQSRQHSQDESGARCQWQRAETLPNVLY